MRRFLPCLLLISLLALPGAGQAQEAEQEQDEAVAGADGSAEEASVEDGGSYEPDQRGVEDGGDTQADPEEQTAGGESYEPDQRGVNERLRIDAPAPMEQSDVEESIAEGDYAASADGGGGIGFDFYLWLGPSLTGIDALEGDNLLLPTQSSTFGGSFGLTLGARIGPLTVGPRLNLVVEPGFVLGAVGVDVIGRLMTGPITPTARVALSYAFAVPTADALPSQNGPDGLLLELGLGVRASLGAGFFLGGELSAGYLALFRSEVPSCTAPWTDGAAFDLRRAGSAHGLTGRLHFFAGWGF